MKAAKEIQAQIRKAARVELHREKKIKPVPVNKDGWSRWQMPIMSGYIMKCCDCGLEHEMEFAVTKTGKKTKNGWYEGKEVKNGRILMRARRTDAN